MNKCVTFAKVQGIIPFVNGTAGKPPPLYAVLVHWDNQNGSFIFVINLKNFYFANKLC